MTISYHFIPFHTSHFISFHTIAYLIYVWRCEEWNYFKTVMISTGSQLTKCNHQSIIIIINKVLTKMTLNKVIAGALYIVICGWNAVKVQGWQLPVLTSRTNRTALLTPCTRACVHAARSRDVWTRNTWASTPCRVPDLVPNVRMSPPPAIDGCFPEWTSLQLHTHRYAYWVCSSSAMSSQ